MQQFPPYFTTYGQPPPQQQLQQQQQQSPQQQLGQDQTQQQPQTTGLNTSNLTTYNPMQSGVPPGAPPQSGFVGVSVVDGAHGKPKRHQVKNACTNCQKACKKCDESRPCPRCIRYGISDTCVSSVRKERKKGVKRGPYKKRTNTNGSATSSGATTPSTSSAAPSVYEQPMQQYFPPTTQAPYDPYAYVNNAQMLPTAYVVPGGILPGSMYPGNPAVLSYQAMIQQQHQQYQQQQQQTNQQLEYRPQEPPVQSTSASISNEPIKGEDDTNQGSKLNLLSRLCTAVLDGDPKQETETPPPLQQNSTPPPSRPRSREPSHEDAYNATGQFAHITNDGVTTTGGIYGTPGSSPAP